MHRRSVLSLLGLGALAGCGGGGMGSGGRGGGNGGGPTSPVESGVELDFRDILQVGTSPAYWVNDLVWGASRLARGVYTGLDGSQFETTCSRSTTLGPNGEIAWQVGWKFPTGVTEVKAFLSAIFGSKPGYANSWTTPGGHKVLLTDDTYSTVHPSGATPGSFLPIATPAGAPGAWPDLFASFDHAHRVTPSGRGQLSFDLWFQSSPVQVNGFGASPITHEVMIALDWWGDYGAYGHRDAGWYSHDVLIDEHLWHVYFVRNFFGGWTFIVFEPDAPLGAGSFNIGAFLRHLATRAESNGQPWMQGTEYLVSVELGVEPVDGIGDVSVSNYRIWRP